MDIEEFDRLYPSPAHAAAADLSDRYAPKPRAAKLRRLHRDPSGTITLVAALLAPLLGGTLYLLKVNGDRPSTYSVQADIPERTTKVVARHAPPAATGTKPLVALRATTERRVSALHSRRPAAPAYKPVRSGAGSSKWIADPLFGEALAAALIVDKNRTIELNADQLKLMAKDNTAKTAVSSPPLATEP